MMCTAESNQWNKFLSACLFFEMFCFCFPFWPSINLEERVEWQPGMQNFTFYLTITNKGTKKDWFYHHVCSIWSTIRQALSHCPGVGTPWSKPLLQRLFLPSRIKSTPFSFLCWPWPHRIHAVSGYLSLLVVVVVVVGFDSTGHISKMQLHICGHIIGVKHLAWYNPGLQHVQTALGSSCLSAEYVYQNISQAYQSQYLQGGYVLFHNIGQGTTCCVQQSCGSAWPS